MIQDLMVFGPQHALKHFEEDAVERGVKTNRSQQTNFSTGPQNVIEALHLIFSKEGAEIVASLAALISAYLHRDAFRTVKMVVNENGKIITLDAKGISRKAMEKLLENVTELIVCEPKLPPLTDQADNK